MNGFFDYKILDNSLGHYLFIAGVILLAFSLRRYLSRILAALVYRLVKRTGTSVDRASFISLVVPPLENFLIVLVVLISFDKLKYPEALDIHIYKLALKRLFELAGIIVLIISFIWLLLRIIDYIALVLEKKANLTPSQTDNQLVLFFKDFFKVILVIIGVLMVLKFGFRFNLSSLITGLSLAGAAIALATRESIENLIASFIIFFDKPFTTGDQIKVHNITGTVEKIGLRSTRLRTSQKTYVTVPNKQMVDSITDNLSLQSQRRAFVQLELNAETPRTKVDELVSRIHALLEKQERVENHTVFLADIVKNAYVISVEFFTGTIPVADFNEVRQRVNLQIIAHLEELEIQLSSRENREGN